MAAKMLQSTVTRAIRSGHFRVLPPKSKARIVAKKQQEVLAEGKLSIVYHGGGEWMVVTIDSKSRQSSTVIIRVKRNGDIVVVNSHGIGEKPFGKLELGVNGVPAVHTEIDLLTHFHNFSVLLKSELERTYHGTGELSL